MTQGRFPLFENDDDYDPRPFIASQVWTYAKTVPEALHEYLPAQRATDFAEFKKMCDWVNKTGTPGFFTFDGKRRRYKYSDPIDGMIYWVSRSPWGSSLLLNRRRAEGY
jgi:hypothetical protein